MATVIDCCIKALDKLGKISDFVQAVKVTPFITHGLAHKSDRCAFDLGFYACRVTFAREDGKDELVVVAEIHFHRRPAKFGGRPPTPRQEFIASFVSQVAEGVRKHQTLLQERSVAWGSLLAAPVESSA